MSYKLGMVDPRTYRERLDTVLAHIATACRDGHRDPASVRLLPVSKTHPIEALRALIELGIYEFGENYAQELAAKAEALGPSARFVFIGRLQSNKIKLIVRYAAEIQSVGDVRHARLVASAAREMSKTPYPVYLVVNAGEESSKTGLALADVPAVASRLADELPDLDIQGIMAIPPPLDQLASAQDLATPGFVPPLYRELAKLAPSIGRGRLSLGMSQDLTQAIQAGSSCVRIGTALFGPRS